MKNNIDVVVENRTKINCLEEIRYDRNNPYGQNPGHRGRKYQEVNDYVS